MYILERHCIVGYSIPDNKLCWILLLNLELHTNILPLFLPKSGMRF